jgi:hypothetical protein
MTSPQTKADRAIKRWAASMQGKTERDVIDAFLIGFCTGSILTIGAYFTWTYYTA